MRGPGRPKKPPSEKRSVKVMVRLTPGEAIVLDDHRGDNDRTTFLRVSAFQQMGEDAASELKRCQTKVPVGVGGKTWRYCVLDARHDGECKPRLRTGRPPHPPSKETTDV